MFSGFKNLANQSFGFLKQGTQAVVDAAANATPAALKPVARRKEVSATTFPAAEELAGHYDDVWDRIHSNGEHIAQQAAANDVLFERTRDRSVRELRAWQTIEGELEALPTFITNTVHLRAAADDIASRLSQLEAQLDIHIESQRRREMIAWKKQVTEGVVALEAKKKKELREMEKTLMIRKQQAEREEKAKLAQKERAAAAAEAKAKAAAAEAARAKAAQEKAAAAAKHKAEAAKRKAEAAAAAAAAAQAAPGAADDDELELELDDEVLDALDSLEGKQPPPSEDKAEDEAEDAVKVEHPDAE